MRSVCSASCRVCAPLRSAGATAWYDGRAAPAAEPLHGARRIGENQPVTFGLAFRLRHLRRIGEVPVAECRHKRDVRRHRAAPDVHEHVQLRHIAQIGDIAAMHDGIDLARRKKAERLRQLFRRRRPRDVRVGKDADPDGIVRRLRCQPPGCP